MRKVALLGLGITLLAALVLVLGRAPEALAQSDATGVHQAISEYTGPETCALCHVSTARDVVDSLHYQHQGPVPYRQGWDEEVLGGMYVTY